PVYQASARLLVQQVSPASASPEQFYPSLLGSQMLAQTYSQMLLARPVLSQVISNLKLSSDVQALAKHSDVQVIRNTQLIQLTVEDESPAQAAAIANNIVQEFSRQNQQMSASRYLSQEQSLQSQLTIIQA